MCFAVSQFITDDLIEDFYYHREDVGSRAPKVTNDKSLKGEYNPKSRDCKIKEISHTSYPDFCDDLLNHMLPEFDESIDPSQYTVEEFNYLIYNKPGHHFIKHRDNNGARWYEQQSFSNYKPDTEDRLIYRVFSVITLIDATDDLKGGNLILWDDDQNIVTPEINVKETIIFEASRHHQVTPIISGTRDALICWVYKI